MVSFDNTEIAFKSKSSAELRKAWWLFRLIGNNSLVKISRPFAGVAAALSPTRYLIKQTIYAHFCGGETINECEGTINHLDQYNVGTILDYSVEGKQSEAVFDATADEIMATQERALKDDKVPFCVFKLTGLGRFALLEKASTEEMLTTDENQELERIKVRVERLCRKAFDSGRRLMLDAEESWIQPIMDKIILDMMRKYNTEKAVLYNTCQMYRHDRLAELKKWFGIAEQEGFYLGVKLVRGAYMEKERKRALEMNYPSPIQPDKASTDRNYNLAIDFIAAHYPKIAVCAGTHNEESSSKLAALMNQKNIASNSPQIYFSQLLGMSDHISFNLANEGYNVAKYVPYGPVSEVLPYLIRRAEENTSVAGQTSRELNLLTLEKERRKKRVS